MMVDSHEEYSRQYPQLLTGIPHYYGDIVRQIFIVASAIILLAAPFYGENLSLELPFEVIGVLVLVTLAALANPHSRNYLLADAVVSGVGLVIFEIWALYGHDSGTWIQFALRELIAILFLVAFYFSMKTVRAFTLHQIGHRDTVAEFDEEQVKDEPRMRMPSPKKKEEDFKPWSMQNHNPGKDKGSPTGSAAAAEDTRRSSGGSDDDHSNTMTLGIGGR